MKYLETFNNYIIFNKLKNYIITNDNVKDIMHSKDETKKEKSNEKKNNFKHETSILRLSNFKSRKRLNWYPKWNLDLSLKKIIEWNEKIINNNARKICEDQIIEFLKR